MKYRYTTLLSDKDLGASGTEIIDITLKDIITAIEVHFMAKAGGTAFSDHPAANITKIELVDGSDVLYSLTGKCAEAMDFYQTRRPRPWRIYHRNGKQAMMTAHLNFGRFWGDRELAFDPTKFDNPQLKITFDEDVHQTSATANTCHVKALAFDEDQPAPVGFLMTKEQKAYTPSSGSWEYTDLPTDYPMRTLGIQCQVAGSDIATSLQDVKLSEDNDKRVPVDDLAEDLAALFGMSMGRYSEYVFAMLTTSLANYFCTPGWQTVVAASPLTADKVVSVQIAQGGQFKAESETAAGLMQAVVTGYLPHQVLPIPFGARDVIEDWYDVTKIGNLRLSLKGGTASTGTYRIITEQNRSY